MSYQCDCGWTFVGDDDREELLARIDHLRNAHGMVADTDQFQDRNAELLRLVHELLHEIDVDELDGWYTSQIERMRDDADEITEWEGVDD